MFIYRILAAGVVWGILVPWTLLRILWGRADWKELRERLGMCSASSGGGILIHAVSLGEVGVAEAVIRAALQQAPDARLLLSAGNAAGRDAALRLQERIPQLRSVGFLPWDCPQRIEKWLQRLAPQSVAVVETEIWPGLFQASARLEIPLRILNGRIYPRDVARYSLLRPFFRSVLRRTRWIGVQNLQEKRRFIQIGADPARLQVAGDAKFDRLLQSLSHRQDACVTLQSRIGSKTRVTQASLPVKWHCKGADHHSPAANCEPRTANNGPFLLAASTHWPEEKWIFSCLPRLKKRFPDLGCLIAPRHLRQVPSIERAARRLGLRPARWTDGDWSAQPWDVLIVDCFGLLPSLFAQADVALIGGTLKAQGGHNPLEAAASRRAAILLGPHTQNIQPIVHGLEAFQGALFLPSRHLLVSALELLFQDAGLRAKLAQGAWAFLESQRGASRLYAAALLNGAGEVSRRGAEAQRREGKEKPREPSLHPA